MSSSTMTSKVHQQKAPADAGDCSEIERLFECCICHHGLNSSCLCPQCSTAFCWKCITSWLATNESCPCCREELVVNDLVQARTFDQAQEVVSRMKAAEDRNRCAVHRKEFSLFCSPCEECICAGCLFAESHREHKDQVILVEEALTKYERKLRKAKEKIKDRKMTVKTSICEVEANEKLLTSTLDAQKKDLEGLKKVDQETTKLLNEANALLKDNKDATSLTAIVKLVNFTEQLNLKELNREQIDVLFKKDLQPAVTKWEFHLERFEETMNAHNMYESLPHSIPGTGFTFRLMVKRDENDKYYCCSLQMEEGVPGEYAVTVNDCENMEMYFEFRKYVELNHGHELEVDEETDTVTVSVEIPLAETYAEKCLQLASYVKRLEEQISDNRLFMQYLADYQAKMESS